LKLAASAVDQVHIQQCIQPRILHACMHAAAASSGERGQGVEKVVKKI
jgi:hypothetical protein